MFGIASVESVCASNHYVQTNRKKPILFTKESKVFFLLKKYQNKCTQILGERAEKVLNGELKHIERSENWFCLDKVVRWRDYWFRTEIFFLLLLNILSEMKLKVNRFKIIWKLDEKVSVEKQGSKSHTS